MNNSNFKKPALWIAFIAYTLLFACAMFHHEMWGDEYHSWNIAKSSSSLGELMTNIRYEGHPPAWYLILWTISKFSHQLVWVQTIHLLIAVAAVFVLLFFSTIPVFTRVWFPFSYYLLFEFTTLSRNYAIGILIACCICVIIRRQFKYQRLLYYALLILLASTHLLGILLAGSLHLYFLLLNKERGQPNKALLLHGVAGILLGLSALWFIFPPADSILHPQAFLQRHWQLPAQLATILYAPLRSLMPIPAWWNHHWWNTQFLLEAQGQYPFLKIVSALCSVGLLACAFAVLRGNRKSLALFGLNVLFTFGTATVFPLTSTRYVGFIFIGFMVAWWLYTSETPVNRRQQWLVSMLLFIQLAGAGVALQQDLKYPFSNAWAVKRMVAEVPQGQQLVTDYWGMIAVSAFADKPTYCVNQEKVMSYLMWKKGEFMNVPGGVNPHYKGVNTFLQQQGLRQVYMITTYSPQVLQERDSVFTQGFHSELLDKEEGGIDRYGDFYLYKISR
ncbi:hypothetical protein F0L74_14175 [Chitinophaga agrisoli]|uniref:Dolichyl-phosphate-mannose-protein mannosyltransferase n=1 Tax=Chitinophaga agrisoli TaxID=2607653 RepID=A0A5B2VZE5_9BACT|nr:hypothetical protein [Chitinophaga agrisoli]KAA2243626.1 hypothetical protein F0L74_14175 [Chitinophaga agrisoli]